MASATRLDGSTPEGRVAWFATLPHVESCQMITVPSAMVQAFTSHHAPATPAVSTRAATVFSFVTVGG